MQSRIGRVCCELVEIDVLSVASFEVELVEFRLRSVYEPSLKSIFYSNSFYYYKTFSVCS